MHGLACAAWQGPALVAGVVPWYMSACSLLLKDFLVDGQSLCVGLVEHGGGLMSDCGTVQTCCVVPDCPRFCGVCWHAGLSRITALRAERDKTPLRGTTACMLCRFGVRALCLVDCCRICRPACAFSLHVDWGPAGQATVMINFA